MILGGYYSSVLLKGLNTETYELKDILTTGKCPNSDIIKHGSTIIGNDLLIFGGRYL